MNADSIRRISAPWFILLTLMLATATTLPFAGRWHWFPDLFAHFVAHYLVGGAALCLALAWARRFSWAALALAVVLWNGWLLSPYLLPGRASQPESGEALEILQFNLSGDNPIPLATIGYVMSLAKPPDVVVLFEVTPEFASDLKRLNQIYPTIAQMPRKDNFGMAVLSRLPESQVKFRESGRFKLPLMVLSGQLGNEKIRLFAVHPPPPMGATLSRERNDQLRNLADEIAGYDNEHIVVAGDLNTTIWSRVFKPFAAKADLRDAQLGHGYLPTWAPPPYARWIGIPIDHTLISGGIEAQRRHVGPWLASDHWPVHTWLVLRRDRVSN